MFDWLISSLAPAYSDSEGILVSLGYFLIYGLWWSPVFLFGIWLITHVWIEIEELREL